VLLSSSSSALETVRVGRTDHTQNLTGCAIAFMDFGLGRDLLQALAFVLGFVLVTYLGRQER